MFICRTDKHKALRFIGLLCIVGPTTNLTDNATALSVPLSLCLSVPRLSQKAKGLKEV